MNVTLPSSVAADAAGARFREGSRAGAAASSWTEYWNASAPARAAGSSFTYSAPLASGVSPVFVRSGAIVPLHVSGPLASAPFARSAHWAAALTLSVSHPRLDGAVVTQVVPFWEAADTTASYAFNSSTNVLQWTVTPSPDGRPVVLLLRWPAAQPPSAVVGVSVALLTDGEAAAAKRYTPAAAMPPGDGSRAPAPVAWDATMAVPPYPIGDTHVRLREGFAQTLAGTFVSVRCGAGAAAPAGDECSPVDAVFVAAEDATAGFRLSVQL